MEHSIGVYQQGSVCWPSALIMVDTQVNATALTLALAFEVI